MGKVIPIKPEFSSPQMVIDEAKDAISEAKACYLVTIDKEGTASRFGTGKLSDLCFAVKVLDQWVARELEEQ